MRVLLFLILIEILYIVATIISLATIGLLFLIGFGTDDNNFCDYDSCSSIDYNYTGNRNLEDIEREKLQTLKQAEQNHLKFVEELKKKLPNTIWGKIMKLEIDNLSKGDGK